MKEVIGVLESSIGVIKTTVDGGISITLNIGSYETEIVKKLLDAKSENKQLLVTFVELDNI